MRRPMTTLMRRPCTALVLSPRWRKLRRVYACTGCGLRSDACVCGLDNVLSLGHRIAEKREKAFRKRMLDAMVEALESLSR